jgi:hypothetical protein
MSFLHRDTVVMLLFFLLTVYWLPIFRRYRIDFAFALFIPLGSHWCNPLSVFIHHKGTLEKCSLQQKARPPKSLEAALHLNFIRCW